MNNIYCEDPKVIWHPHASKLIQKYRTFTMPSGTYHGSVLHVNKNHVNKNNIDKYTIVNPATGETFPMFLDDKVKTFSNKDLIRTCFGIPKISYFPKRKYNLHLAFIDGGREVDYIFVDKYECGNVDGIFTSSQGIEPCSTHSCNNPISNLKNNPDNNYGGLYKAVKTRGKKHFLTSVLIWNALGMLKYVHNNYKLEQTEFHNNHKCGVKWINPYRYEVGSGLTKFDAESNIFKVLKQSVSYRDLKDDDAAYNEDLYDDLDLTDIMKNGSGFMFLDDKVKTFSDKDLTRTCFGIPKSNALSNNSNSTYGKAGIFLYKRKGLAVLVGGN